MKKKPTGKKKKQPGEELNKDDLFLNEEETPWEEIEKIDKTFNIEEARKINIETLLFDDDDDFGDDIPDI